MAGISEYLASGWLSTLRNTPFVIPTFCFQLHTGDPAVGALLNMSAMTDRQIGTLGAPDPLGFIATTGEPPAWAMNAAETIKYVSIWDALSAGNWLGNAVLTKSVTVADGDIFRMGGGFKLKITGLA